MYKIVVVFNGLQRENIMYWENTTGPKIEPWGTPQVVAEDEWLPIVTENVLFLMYVP